MHEIGLITRSLAVCQHIYTTQWGAIPINNIYYLPHQRANSSSPVRVILTPDETNVGGWRD